MSNKWVAVLYGVAGLVGAYALAQEVLVRQSEGTYDGVDLWSHFTYQSNLFAVVVCTLTCTFTFWKGETYLLTWLRGAATLYMLMTGVIYSLLVNNADPAVMIDHYIMHYVMPVAMVILWLLYRPENYIDSGHEMGWLIYPLLYVAYVFVEGAVTGDYYYEFLNPQAQGWFTVLLTVVGLTAAVAIIARAMRWISNKRTPVAILAYQ